MNKNSEIYERFVADYSINARAIPVNFREIVKVENFDRLTHYLYSYPAKLLQCIPIFFIDNSALSQKGDIVYDPFCGSGTVPLEAIHSGRVGMARDVNPFACLLAKVKTTYIEDIDILKYLDGICDSYSQNRPKSISVKNSDIWYNKSVFTALSKLSSALECCDNLHIKNFFEICFVSTARKLSNADPRISVPVRLNPEKYAVGSEARKKTERILSEKKGERVLDLFLNVVDTNIRKLNRIAHLHGKSAHIMNTSAVFPPEPQFKGQVDLIVTSPPYPGAQKYIRASSLDMRWLGMVQGTLTELKRCSIGREDVVASDFVGDSTCPNADTQIRKIYKVNKERATIAEAYLREMRLVFRSGMQHLKKDGHLVMITANNSFCGMEFFTSSYLNEIANDEGFELILELVDDIKSYGLMTKRNKTAGIISQERVSVFRKKNES